MKMVDEDVRNAKLHAMVSRQRDRAIAIILDYKERDCDRHLPPDVQRRLRKVVLDQLNDFTGFCIDLLDSVDTGGAILNEHFLQLLTEIHEAIALDEDDDG